MSRSFLRLISQLTLCQPDATLDTLISAHNHYLKSITRKGLLAPSTSSSSTSAADFTIQLHELLKLMLAYKEVVEQLYSYSVAEFTKQTDRTSRIAARTKAQTWGVTERDEEEDDDNNDRIAPLVSIPGHEGESVLATLRERLSELQRDFRARVDVLLGDLAYQPDTDMRFLGVVMNFNDVYKPVKRKRGGKERERPRRDEQMRAGAEAA